MMCIALVIVGCKKDDKDDPAPSGKAALIAGHFYWGYGEEGNVSNGSSNYFQLEVLADGKSAVLTGEGEAPLAIAFAFDKDDNVTATANKHALWGTIKGVEINEAGTEIRISGTSEYNDGRDRSGDYVIVLKKQAKSQEEMWAEMVRGCTYLLTWQEADEQGESLQDKGFGNADEVRLVFDDKNSAVLTTAGECPMTITWKVDAWNNWDLQPKDAAWTRANGGLKGDAIWASDGLTAFEYYGELQIGYINWKGNFYLKFKTSPTDVYTLSMPKQ